MMGRATWASLILAGALGAVAARAQSPTPEQLVAFLTRPFPVLEEPSSGGCGATYEEREFYALLRQARVSVVAAGEPAVPALETELGDLQRKDALYYFNGIGYLAAAYAEIRGKEAVPRLMAIQYAIAPEILGSIIDHALALALGYTSVISYHRQDIREFCARGPALL